MITISTCPLFTGTRELREGGSVQVCASDNRIASTSNFILPTLNSPASRHCGLTLTLCQPLAFTSQSRDQTRVEKSGSTRQGGRKRHNTLTHPQILSLPSQEFRKEALSQVCRRLDAVPACLPGICVCHPLGRWTLRTRRRR